MGAVVLHAPGDIRREDRLPPLAARPGRSGRASPLSASAGPTWRGCCPPITGHEFSGHICAIGDAVEGWKAAELVAMPPLLPCNACDRCRTGNFSRCRDCDCFGSRRDGAHAEDVAVPVTNLLTAPQHVDPRAIAVTDPASIALHAI